MVGQQAAGAHTSAALSSSLLYGVEMASSNLGMDGKNLSWNLHARSSHTTAHSSALGMPGSWQA